jgi:outer membrane immunogenic protein
MLKSTLHFVAAAALGLGLVQSASAADLPTKAAPMYTPAPFTWTGFYIGGHVGSGWGTVESTVTSITAGGVPVGAGALPFSSHNVNGFLGGVQAGYNWQVGPTWVVGIEGDFSWSDINGTTPCLVVLACKTKEKWLADITGRVGFTVDHALIYLKGGAAWADSDYSVTFTPFLIGGGPGFAATASDTRFGGLLGVGVEYAITRNLSAKVEYNYIDFGSHNVTVATTVAGAPFTATSSIDQQMHLIKAGVNYRF